MVWTPSCYPVAVSVSSWFLKLPLKPSSEVALGVSYWKELRKKEASE
jgi:hypothetical protein